MAASPSTAVQSSPPLPGQPSVVKPVLLDEAVEGTSENLMPTDGDKKPAETSDMIVTVKGLSKMLQTLSVTRLQTRGRHNGACCLSALQI